MLLLTCYILSRLKGIETRFSAASILADASCYILSRLKGIETFSPACACAVSVVGLLHTFPFEGN